MKITQIKKRAPIPRKVRAVFVSTDQYSFLISTFNAETVKLTDFFNKLEEILLNKEIPNPPTKQFSFIINNLGIRTTAKFSINPFLSEAPPALLSTLNSKLLDLSVVRAEVAILCFENLLNIPLPTHVFLLSNFEQDFIVKAPSLKTLIKRLRRKQYRFRRRYEFFGSKLLKHFERRKRRFYFTERQFFTVFSKRIYAACLQDDQEEMDEKPASLLAKRLRVELGTLRTLRCGIIQVLE